MKATLSIETHGHSNVIAFHDGKGNKTILADESLDADFYAECKVEALRLRGKDLILEVEGWLSGLCSNFRHDRWKACLFKSLTT